jgi:hypothetical protein
VLVIAMETGPGRVRWAGRRHDDDRPGASSGTSPAGLFDAVFRALHDGEQVALGFDTPLTSPVPGPAGRRAEGAGTLVMLAEPAMTRPGIAELGHVLGELGTWRPWTTVSTSLSRWKANTSILVWEAVPAGGSGGVAASAAAEGFFRYVQPGAARQERDKEAAPGPFVNLAAAAARRAGLLADPAELARPAASITVSDG